MLNKQRKTVAVIGAGIIGASIAFHLTLRGVQVAVIDSGDPGQGTSRISFAWINAYGKEPYHYHDLNRRSLDLWDRFARWLGGDVGLTWGGDLRWAVTEKGAEQLIAHAKQVQSWGYPTKILDVDAAQAIEPNLSMGSLVVASYTHSEGQVDVERVTRACIAGATEQGAELYLQQSVTEMQFAQSDSGQSSIAAIKVGDKAIACSAVVLAGGADTPTLAKLAGIEVPLYHTRGVTIITEPMPPLFQTIATFHSPRDGQPLVNCRQFADGTVMVQGGAHSDDDGDRGRTDAEVAQILAEVIGFVPALAGAKVKEVRRGRRPIPQDGLPILGFTQAVPNLYIATTHSGVTLAPIIGEFASIEIAEGVVVERLEPYRLERFHS